MVLEWNVTIDRQDHPFRLLEGEVLDSACRQFCYFHGCDLESMYKLERLMQQVVKLKVQVGLLTVPSFS
jgi:hypothetical protein